MKATTKISLIAALFMLLSSNFLIAQEERELASFDEISIIGNIEVTLIKGEAEKAVIHTENIDPIDVGVHVSGGILKMRLLKTFQKDVKVKVELTYSSLRTIKGSAGAKITGESQIDSDILYVRAHSGAHLELQVRADELNAATYEGGVILLEGNTESQTITAATGGQYKALDLDCDRTKVKVNTGGQANVVANKALDASANTGGQIEYKGSPSEKNTKTLFSGRIKQV